MASEFDWESQAKPHVPPSNCIPSACMIRKSMWERAGAIRLVYAPGEDAEFWTRGLSVGFTAKKVSDQPLFEYRMHGGSASRTKTYNRTDILESLDGEINSTRLAHRLKWLRLSRSYSQACNLSNYPGWACSYRLGIGRNRKPAWTNAQGVGMYHRKRYGQG